jgi:hypothetical protein
VQVEGWIGADHRCLRPEAADVGGAGEGRHDVRAWDVHRSPSDDVAASEQFDGDRRLHVAEHPSADTDSVSVHPLPDLGVLDVAAVQGRVMGVGRP